MHFALPPRKTSRPPPYLPRTSTLSPWRRRRLKWAAVIFVVLALFFFQSHLFSFSGRIPAGTPRVVLVTPIDEEVFSKDYIAKIRLNREKYAERHGYKAFFPLLSDYDVKGASRSWARIPATRHAITLYPYSTYFVHLDPTVLIMNPALEIENHIISRKRIESLMLRDHPVVPPDSIIKTFSHLRGDHVDLVLTQDADGLEQGAFILRQGEWAKFFLDSWFDPLYRNYNFQKAEGHAMEHMVQWHPTILTRLALVPTRILNSQSTLQTSGEDKDAQQKLPLGDASAYLYQEGDFVVHLKRCDAGPHTQGRACDKEIAPFWGIWKSVEGVRK